MTKMLSSMAALLLVFALSPASAQTGVIEDDFVGCLTDAYFDDHTMAVTSRNWAQRFTADTARLVTPPAP